MNSVYFYRKTEYPFNSRKAIDVIKVDTDSKYIFHHVCQTWIKCVVDLDITYSRLDNIDILLSDEENIRLNKGVIIEIMMKGLDL